MDIKKWMFLLPVISLFGDVPVFQDSFEDDGTENWIGGSFGGGSGKAERTDRDPVHGKYALHLLKESGSGGVQRISRPIPLPGTGIRLSFQYRGGGVLNLKFMRKDGNRWVPAIAPTGEPASLRLPLKQSKDWVLFQKELNVPESYLADCGSLILQFMVWAGKNAPGELCLDDLVILPEKVKKTEKIVENMRIAIADPDEFPAEIKKKIPLYGKMPAAHTFEIRDGLLLRDGKPHFWVGDGMPVTPQSIWLSRLQGLSVHSLNGESHLRIEQQGNHVRISRIMNRTAASQSWQRELIRNGFLTGLCKSPTRYKWSPLRQYAEKIPALREFFYDMGHGVSTDSLHPEGARLLELVRYGAMFYPSALSFPCIFELIREPGVFPSNGRHRQAFRKWAREKYGTIAEANHVWRKHFRDWEEVIPPHLETAGILNHAMQLQLRGKVARDFPEMYYDWLRFAQLDYAECIRIEIASMKRKYPDLPVAVDIRGHRTDSDCYANLDPDLIDPLEDLFFLHGAFLAFSHNENPTDLDTLNRQLVFPFFCYNFFKTNSRKPLWDSENIIGNAGLPGSNADFMKRNDLGKFHLEPWKFRRDEQNAGLKEKWFAFEYGDRNWNTISVPGSWDRTKTFSGYSGIAWYRKTFRVPAELRMDYQDGSRKFYLYGKGIAQQGTIWLNGTEIGHVKGWNADYQFDVGPYLRFGKENQITIRVDGNGYDNGIRFYLHLLPHDRINGIRPFSEKEYASMLYTQMMRGLSAVMIWNWGADAIRPYMPALIGEIDSLVPVFQPVLRKRSGKIAYLYSYLYGKGLPSASDGKTYNDQMHWYNALEFSQGRPDVFSEKNILTVTPEKYPLTVVPYSGIVHGKTWEHLKEYVRKGGSLVVTCDSLLRTFDRYESTRLEEFAGLRFCGEYTGKGVLTLNGRDYNISRGDQIHKKGVKIAASPDVKVLAVYPDGAPCVTERRVGKGRIRFVAPRLDLFGVQAVLHDLLPEPDIGIISGQTKEYPFVEAVLCESGDRALVYLHNWGGMTHPLRITVPEKYCGWNARSIRRKFTSGGVREFAVTVPSSSPAVLLLEKPGTPPLKMNRPTVETEALMRRLVQLKRDAAGQRPAVLFLKPHQRYLSCTPRTLQAVILDYLDRMGYESLERKITEWSPEYLRRFKLVILDEIHAGSIPNDKKFTALMKNYVQEGGSLLVMGPSIPVHVNSTHLALRNIGAAFGASMTGRAAFDSRSHGYGDPSQIRSKTMTGFLTDGVRNIQFFTAAPFRLKKDSPLKAVVCTNPSDESVPELPLIAAGEYGSGRIALSACNMWTVPLRADADDNARMLVNLLNYLLRRDLSPRQKQKLAENPLTF